MSDDEGGKEPENWDERLDFTSAHFDAAAALQHPDLQPPVPDAPLLDNVSKCAALVPGPAEEAPAARVASEESKAKAAALKRRAQKAAERAEASVTTGSLASIMALAASGPLAILARWQAARQRVLVVTRHAAGVRARAVGTLAGFDRFMNLLLSDAEEWYTVMVRVPRVKQQQQLPAGQPTVTQQQKQQQQQQLPASRQGEAQLQPAGADPLPLPTSQQQQGQSEQPAAGQQLPPQQQQQQAAVNTRVRWCRKQEHRFRRLALVLVKGDNVVLVSSCGAAAAAAEAAAAARVAAATQPAEPAEPG